MTSRPSFISELARRNVFRMAGLYLVGSWLIVQVTGTVGPMLGAPEWVGRTVLMLLAIGFVPALVFSWVYEITPEGLKRESEVDPQASITPATAQRLDRAIIVLLVLALAAFSFDRFYLTPRREATLAQAQVQAKPQAQAPVAEAAPAAAAATDKSIAVLPFANTSGDPANEYFSDGMSEELINTLGRLKDLTVIGRSSSFQFKGKGEAPTAIGAKLGVAYLLDGSVRKAADKVRIAVELVRASNGASVWSETYDRELQDIFAVQSEIAQQVARKLQATLLAGGGGPAGELKPDAPPSGSVEAYNAVLQGNFYFGRRTSDDIRRAIELYEHAVSLDPQYALALARLVYARAELDASFTPSVGDARKALRAQMEQDLATAQRLDPRSAEVPLARGYMMEVFDLDVAGATAEFLKSAELAPQNPATAFRLAAGQGYIGEYEASLAGFHHVLALDPLSARGHLYLSIVLSRIGRFDEAEAALEKAIELQPQAAVQHAYLAVVHVMQGRGADAVAAAKAEPDEFWRNWGLAFAHWANGDRAASDQALDWLIKNDAHDAGSQIAQIYAQRGQDDEVFRWLDHAFETNDGGLQQIRISPMLAKYEKDPRYEAIARRVRVWSD